MKFDLKYNLSTHEDGTPVTPTLLLVYYSESQVGRYISIAHSIRKWQISTLQWAKTPNWYWWNLAWLTTSGIPPYMTTLVGSLGKICGLSHLWVSFLSSIAFFVTRQGRISWPIGTIYMSKRVFCFRPRMCLLGVSTISDYNSQIGKVVK